MKNTTQNTSLESIADEVRDKVKYLIRNGYSPDIIDSWIKESITPGGLAITRDCRIILTRTGKEVVMHPLEKVLYLFFLRSENGYKFKELPQHKGQLLKLYNRLTVFDDTQENQSHIDRLVNPLNKSFLEKCSIIRRIFMAEMPAAEAEFYCISGRRGEPRKISIDRSLVKWEMEPMK